MNILETYIERVSAMYSVIHPELNPQDVRTKVEEFVHKSFRDIPCVLNNNVKHERVETTVSKAMDWIEQRDPIITGNGTFFMQHDELLAPIIKVLEPLKAIRSGIKKEMYTYDPSTIQYANLNTDQGNVKVAMNAEYGGSGTQYSPFYSVYIPPATTGTAKNVTTTLICCLEFLSCNDDKWAKLKDINELFDMLFIVINDNEERELINDTYTVEEVTKYLVSRMIFWDTDDVKVIRSFLQTLEPRYLTKIMLAFNVRLVLRKYLYNEMTTISDYMKSHQLNVNDTITEESLMVSGFGVNAPEALLDIFEHVKKVINDNCCYPFMLNDAEIRANEMMREVVCVTDTDSLMVHFASYINEFQTNCQDFRDSCLCATAIGLRLFVEDGSIIPKMVDYVAKGYRIRDPYYRKKFKFKNEFGFLAMALFAKKMYASSCFVQEGKPRNIHKIAISGMSFKKRDAAEFLAPIMIDMYDKKILTIKNIRVEDLLDDYEALRESMEDKIDKDTSFYQVLGLKEVGAYDKTKVLPEQMRGALVWNAMNPENEMQPMDRVIVIRLSWKRMLANQDKYPEIQSLIRYNQRLTTNDTYSALTTGGDERMGMLIDNEDMKRDPVICIPEENDVIPDWISVCIDREETIDKLLTPCKQMFGLFDVYMADTKTGTIPSRMVCI
jgi:hypothetical protein